MARWDVNGIEMQVIPQTQFIPLPEILCLVILELNNQRVVATLNTIQERLLKCYSETETPNLQVLYDTLGSLIRERKVFHTGSGYFVVTPDTYRLPTDNPGAQQFPLSWLHYNPMYIPVLDDHKPPCRSISCQVSIAGQQQNSCPQQEVKKSPSDQEPVTMPTVPSHKARLSRSLSARRAVKEKSGGQEEPTFKRSSSVKHRGDNKSKPTDNDVNLTKSNINKAKDKGEKKSLLSKIFGRNKKKSSASTESPSEKSSKDPKKEIEYATFSAQFPPPEWQWYENKVEKYHRTQDWICEQLSQYTELPQDVKVNDIGKNKCASKNNKENKMESKSERHRKPLVEQRCHSHRKRDSLRHAHSAHRNSIDKALREKVESSGPRDYVNIDVARNYIDQWGEMEQHHTHINPYHIPKQKSPEEVYGHFTAHNNVDQFHIDNSHHNDVVHHSHRQKKNVNHYSMTPYNIPPGNDISFEYQGRLPKKNSAYAVSRDSGVNCVGLKQQKKETKHTYVRRHHRHSVHESVPTVRHEDKQNKSEKHEKHHHNHNHHQHHQHHQHQHQHHQRIQNNLNSDGIVNGASVNSDRNEIVCVAEINHCNPLQNSDLEDNLNSKVKANNGEYISEDVEGTESLEERSEQSYDTVIDSRQIINSPIDNVMQQTEELVLGDSGFSSPRNFDNSMNVDLTPGILRNDNDCPKLASHKCSKNFYQKSDNSSQSSGNCERKMVELSSSYDEGKILNNLKHVYKENIVAEHLNNVITNECHNLDEDNEKLMQQLPKKFDFDDGDYRVVGIV
ncbi:hypothetical protein KUTeg_003569 [Tegillarca granosa]|uniref:Winged helix Storkhead-box1 domain-containing protein n=1 Tax=Tegillarca granosa TaxID=220873 RepID=A0ABQ9FS11_TEGGR|nr:hypothetical protein KUTeg_003569 [Tegillarca granosa]